MTILLLSKIKRNENNIISLWPIPKEISKTLRNLPFPFLTNHSRVPKSSQFSFFSFHFCWVSALASPPQLWCLPLIYPRIFKIYHFLRYLSLKLKFSSLYISLSLLHFLCRHLIFLSLRWDPSLSFMTLVMLTGHWLV